ncbi:hypothetical protein COOONC_06585 [Cooperia oncophora]
MHPKPHIALARRSKGYDESNVTIARPHRFIILFQIIENASINLRLTLPSEDRALVAELRETVGKSNGDILRKKEPRPQTTIQLHGGSTPQEVSTWLQEKGFSLRVIELLDGQDGANLFALNKTSLMQACGKEEGSRLYSQLLVQKNQSNVSSQSHCSLNFFMLLYWVFSRR